MIPEDLQNIFPAINKKGNDIYSKSAYTMEELVPNHIMAADNRLLGMKAIYGSATDIHCKEN